MSWSITEMEVRRMTGEHEISLSLPNDIDVITEDTILRYCDASMYETLEGELITQAPIYAGGLGGASNINISQCANDATLVATVIGAGVSFSVDNTNVTSQGAATIFTRLAGNQNWVSFNSTPVRSPGEVFLAIHFVDGCPSIFKLYTYDLQGNLTPNQTNQIDPNTPVYDVGSIVQHRGQYWQALIANLANTPLQHPFWQPVKFVNTISQRVWQDALGPIIALRCLRSGLPSAKSQLRGGQLIGGMEAATSFDYKVRLEAIDERVNRYVRRLERIAHEDTVNEKYKTDNWGLIKKNTSCNTTQNYNPLNFIIT